jgi:bis(5'-nucleosyl)-tetraphosphatase (symmetrical)
VRSLGDRAVALLGNHDLSLLAVAQGTRKAHASDTIADILQADDREELLDWLRHRPLAYAENDCLMVHAGVLPQWTMAQTLALAEEVHQVLRGPGWGEFLRDMYGNQPTAWNDKLTGMDRLRCIVNALTRIRFCTPEGEMELTVKDAHGTELPGYLPWFDLPGRKTADATVIFGHWSTLGLVMRPDIIGLDTGCVWGGKLTAVRLADRAVLQTACPQYQAPG